MPYSTVVATVILYALLDELVIYFFSKLSSSKKVASLSSQEVKNVIVSDDIVPKQNEYVPDKSALGEIDVGKYFLICKIVYGLFTLVYLMNIGTTVEGNFTSWDRYQMIYDSILNSFPGNLLSAMFSDFIILHSNENEDNQMYVILADRLAYVTTVYGNDDIRTKNAKKRLDKHYIRWATGTNCLLS